MNFFASKVGKNYYKLLFLYSSYFFLAHKMTPPSHLSNWDKPSYACMSSRFPYGEAITEGKLVLVAAAEDYLRSIGLRQFRVRHHDTIARIEILPEDFPQIITKWQKD